MPAPRVIGPYEIVDLLGRGGMGEVYKAVDTRMYRRPVALKLLSEAMAADPRALSRFDLEIATAANLRHPNIVQIYERGEHEGRRYFAMELLEGRDLTAIIKERDLRPLDARLDIIVQLCDALDYAHSHGVVHRDIKPANILVITRGGTDHVKLVDFGIVHVARAEHTRTVVQPGTMLYMSPEQLQDESVTPRSDLFSLGIVGYELCAGVHPFKGKTEYLTSSNIMFEQHAPLGLLEPSAPEELGALFDRLLDKQSENRPASAGAVGVEVRAIVRQLRSGPSEITIPSFGNLDQMTGTMVERIVHWANSKEMGGAVVEALEAYKRAILLAPDSPWLAARVAQLEERLKQAPALDVTPVDDPALRTSSRNRHRESFVRERMVEADAALDEGELDRASSIVAAILRQYPDEGQALALMDRIVLITDRALPVKSYRKAIRTAREAIAHGDLPEAVRSCEAAVAIWPDDAEVITLGHEIEKLRQVEMAKALMIGDGLLQRAAAGTLGDDAAPSQVAEALAALSRAEEMGAPPTLLGGKREALDRILRDAQARTHERARAAREAEEARRAEIKRLLDDAGRRLPAVERAVPADPASARAALADVEAARGAISRADALGADPAETTALRGRLDAAARALADHIERREASDRQIVARVDAIRASLAEVEQLAVGEADDAQRAGELLRVVESELADVSAGRPSDKELPGLRSTAAGLRERLTERRRAADEHRARAEREKREHEEKARRERESRERKLRLESEQAAGKRAGEATQRKAARRAVMRPWLLRGAGVIVVAVAAGGVWMLNERQRQKSAAAEIARLEQVRRTRAEAVLALQGAVKEIEAIATAISAIDSEDARTSALARCDRVSTEIDAASRLDPSNVDGPRIKVDLSALRSRILGVAIGRPPSPPADDLAAALGEIGADLEAAGRSPAAPLAAVDEALSRADHGIAMAQDILKARPSESRARSLLASLRETRGVLQRRHDGLVDRPKQESVAIKPPDVRPPPPPIPESVSNTQREKFEELLGDAKRQPLSTPEGAAGRIALDRQALDLAAQARGQEWAPAKRADAQTDLDTALVWSLFHKFRDALVARNKESIVAVYPQYPSTEAIAELRAFQYSFEIVDLDLGAKTVSVRETTRGHQRPNFWEPPMTATRKYNLDRRSDGSWFIVSGTLAR